jgi:phosphate transport system protein
MSDNNEHIVAAFDRDLDAIEALVVKMGGLVEAAIHDAAQAVTTRDLDLAEKVRAGDKVIDALELQINEETARTLALRAPMSTDLRILLTALKVAAGLERAGDYARNLAKRTEALAALEPISGTDRTLRRMTAEVQTMLRNALDAFVRRDVELAEQVRQHDEEVDELYNALFREFLTFMMENPRNITACMHLHFIAKNVERMGDLATNMAEQVIYMVSGELPGDVRPKGDQTSFMTGQD